MLPNRFQGSIVRLAPPAASGKEQGMKKLKDKELAFKGLILPEAPILTSKDGSIPPLVADEGEGADEKEKPAGDRCRYVPKLPCIRAL